MLHSPKKNHSKNSSTNNSNRRNFNSGKYSSSQPVVERTIIPKQWSEAKQLLSSFDTTLCDVNTTKCVEDILEVLNSISYPIRSIDNDVCIYSD